MLQQMLFDRLAIDHGAVGTAQIQHKRTVRCGIDGSVLTTHSEVINDDIIAWPTPYRHAGFGNADFLLYQTIKGDDDLRHNSLINSM